MSPRAFDAEERERLRAHLLEIAENFFGRYGYRRVSVADIAAEAGIGKGSLYLFFRSKSALFLAVVQRVEEEHRSRLVAGMEGEFSTPRARLKRFLHLSAQSLLESPLLAVMTDPQEVAALQRDLPAEVRADLHESDNVFFRDLAAGWRCDGTLGDVDPDVVAALPRAVYALILQREIIGSAVFPATLELILDAVSRSLVERDGDV